MLACVNVCTYGVHSVGVHLWHVYVCGLCVYQVGVCEGQ